MPPGAAARECPSGRSYSPVNAFRMNYNIFFSRTFWTVAAMFVIGGLNAITQALPADFQAAAMGILSVLAVYFHINPSQRYNPP
jgi:hypothetical protein